MTFVEWLCSSYPNPKINGQWGLLHILVLVLSIATIVALALIFRKKDDKTRYIVICVLAGLILFFEIARRTINIVKTDDYGFKNILYIFLPRPWCAISCWSIIIATIFRKKYMYNFASFSSLLCAIIFFAYPSAGFNKKYILFENLYSISTHALLLITSITLITLKQTKFEYQSIWKDMICLLVIFIYTMLEIYVLKISSDPMYFMPNNDVQDILGLSYGAFLPLYIIFMFVYINIFYLIDDRQKVKSIFKPNKK